MVFINKLTGKKCNLLSNTSGVVVSHASDITSIEYSSLDNIYKRESCCISALDLDSLSIEEFIKTRDSLVRLGYMEEISRYPGSFCDY